MNRVQQGGILLIMVLAFFIMAASNLALKMATQTTSHLTEYKLTEHRMKRAAQALYAYWLTHACPTLPNALPFHANGALNDSDTNAGRGVGGPATNATLPWRDLGLAEQDALDAWGRRLTYVRQPASLTDNGTSQTVIWVLVSHGPSGLGGWLPTGQRMPLPPIGNTSERSNTGGIDFFKAPTNAPSGINPSTDLNHFDDIVVYGKAIVCNDWTVAK